MDYCIISEIHYHPLGDEASLYEDSDYEFLEIKNTDTAPLDLSGIIVSDAIQFAFPPSTVLGPGEYFLLASNTAAFHSRYGFSPSGEYEGKLDNAGEGIVMTDADGNIFKHLIYDDNFPWPSTPDGSGYSLEFDILNPFADQNIAANWAVSLSIHGTPGTDKNSTVKNAGSQRIINNYEIFPCAYNPLTGTIRLKFYTPKACPVSFRLLDMLGRQPNTAVKRIFPAGENTIYWNTTQLAAGLYFITMETTDFHGIKPLTIIR